MLEVTADSNIYISALQFAGTPLRFLTLARAGVFRLTLSNAIVAEVSRILRTKFLWDDERLSEALADIGDFTTLVYPARTLSVVAEDPDDDRILECAVAAGSHYIVSGDGDLLRLGQYGGIRIMKVAEFLRMCSGSPA